MLVRNEEIHCLKLYCSFHVDRVPRYRRLNRIVIFNALSYLCLASALGPLALTHRHWPISNMRRVRWRSSLFFHYYYAPYSFQEKGNRPDRNSWNMLVLCEVSNFVNIVNWKVIEMKQSSFIMHVYFYYVVWYFRECIELFW